MHKGILLAGLLVGVLVIAGAGVGIALQQPQVVGAASADYFLKIDGVEGSSGASGHAGEIEIESWSFGATNVSATSGGMGAGVGKVSSKAITIKKELDKTSPLLYKASVSGRHIKDATFKANLMGSAEYVTIHMSDVMVSSYSMSGDQGYRPTETVSFTYSKIEITWPKSLGDVVTTNSPAATGSASAAGTVSR